MLKMNLDFPLEVLRDIFRLLTIDDLVCLWKTGHLSLQRAIANGGVNTLYLYDNIRFPRCLWPDLVFHWQFIRHVDLRTSAPTLCLASDVQAKIKLLPKTLQSLRLKTTEAEDILVETDVDNLSRLKSQFLAYHGSYADIQPYLYDYQPTMINLAEIFPELTTLEIKGEDAILRADDLFCLPPNLTYLSWSNSLLDESLFKYFPSSLIGLDINSTSLNLDLSSFQAQRHPKWHHFLPPLLTSLKLHIRILGEIRVDQLAELPRRLEFLDISGCGPYQPYMRSALPKTLTHLRIGSGFIDHSGGTLPELPSNLRSARLRLTTKDSVFNLPPCITSLDLLSQIGCVDHLSSLPDSITRLLLSGTWVFPHDGGLDFLPSSLTHLEVTEWGRKDSNIGLTLQGNWPRGLKTLKFEGISSWPTNKIPICLPPQLHTLSLSMIRPGDEVYLPTSLTSLQVNSVNTLQWDLLPHNLKTLHLNVSASPDADSVKLLPRGLTSFIISCDNPTHDIQVPLQHMDWPLKLTRLDLQYFRTPVSVSDVQSLPRGLTMLSLPLVKTFEQDGIRELPPYLKALDLNSAITLDGSCFIDLPRCLEILKVQGISSVSKYQLADLPRGLTTLLMGTHVDFGSDAWPLLPITLSTWNIRHTAEVNPGWFSSDRLGDYRMYSGPYTRGNSKRVARIDQHKKAISKESTSCSIQ